MAETQKLTRRKGWGKRVVRPLAWPGLALRSLSRNPIILKELRWRMRSGRAFFLLSFYVGLLSIVAILAYSVAVPRSNNYYGSYNYSYYNNYDQLGNGIFTTILTVQLLLILVMAPSFTTSALSGEKESQTYEILLLTLLSAPQIILGKLLSTLAYLFLLVIAALPVESIVFLVGGVGADQLAVGLIIPLVAAVVLGSMGIFWSSFLRTTSRASRSTYLSALVLLLGFPGFGIPLANFIYGNGYSDKTSLFLLNWASAFNPGIGLIATNEILTSNSSSIKSFNIFYYIRNNGDIYPMPWLISLAMALALSFLFITLAIRCVKPLKVEGSGGRILKK